MIRSRSQPRHDRLQNLHAMGLSGLDRGGEMPADDDQPRPDLLAVEVSSPRRSGGPSAVGRPRSVLINVSFVRHLLQKGSRHVVTSLASCGRWGLVATIPCRLAARGSTWLSSTDREPMMLQLSRQLPSIRRLCSSSSAGVRDRNCRRIQASLRHRLRVRATAQPPSQDEYEVANGRAEGRDNKLTLTPGCMATSPLPSTA
ncbi:hypothetical protein CDD80_7252 [Ophiocordyceps camponoti-rufipedis]|uniref:Uncharacterized protein n=1 Tax=Ophiocordyceps camponoti-rufipedis TaxID=2004952 RepID=A0A2C5ZAW0_9HYPO|nr:hypothetical protein CDD80_7252 [Ophiocordyceps camponoti-rufipedis]